MVNDDLRADRVVTDVVEAGNPLLRYVRTRMRRPQTNHVVERYFGPLRHEHRCRAAIGDGNALAVEVTLFRCHPPHL